MSRLIVKNLPAKIDVEKLRKMFSTKGDVTDVQLRYTSEGKFRKFAFVGFKTEEQAAAALKHFDNSFYNTSRIKVELCSILGSTDKTRAWSKHTKIINDKSKDIHDGADSNLKKSKKHDGVDKELLKKIVKHKDEPEFREFLEAHGDPDRVLGFYKEKEEYTSMEEGDSEPGMEEEEPVHTETSAAHAPITDMEYLKLKMKRSSCDIHKFIDEKKYDKLYTIKIKNLPKGVKKQDIRDLLKPLAPVSVRRARGLLGIAYIGFKTEKEMKKALIKNKTFLNGKQLHMSECVEVKSSEKEIPDKWRQQEEGLVGEESIGESGRIFLRNLYYSVTEEELETLLSQFGPISEISLPIDKLTRKAKGYGTVTFVFPEHAVAAYSALDGTVFQGRMLHLLPAKSRDSQEELDSNNYKQVKQAKLKKFAGLSHNWNTLFLGRNAVADIIAETYKTSKQNVLTGREGAVRLALGETQLVSSTRDFLIQNGIDLSAFNQQVDMRSKNVILVKNLPANTRSDEVRDKFEKFGVLGRVVLPPSGIMAVVEFEHPSEARIAFTRLSYTKFKNLPLYLEWAPQNTFFNIKTEMQETEVQEQSSDPSETTAVVSDVNPDKTVERVSLREESSDEELDPEPDTTLYVKNLNFETTEDQLKHHFSSCGKLARVILCRKKDPKHPSKVLSLGYGFVQFYLRSHLNKALAELQGSYLGGHELELKRSDRTVKPLAFVNRKLTNVKKQTSTKILVRNIPFQANAKEIKQLFGTFGQIKCVRMPKKLIGTGNHRGFGFVEFSTKQEAKAAMKALCQSTHLYGRRLVLEWAAIDEEQVENIRKRTADHFHSDEIESRNKLKAHADLDMGDSDEEL